jgi:hypothetical protein
VFPSGKNVHSDPAEKSWQELATLYQAVPQSHHHHHGSSFLPKPVTLAKKSLLFGGSDATAAAKTSEFKKPAPPVSSAVFGMLPFFLVPYVCFLLVYTSVADPGCLSRIPDPGSNGFKIPDPHQRT